LDMEVSNPPPPSRKQKKGQQLYCITNFRNTHCDFNKHKSAQGAFQHADYDLYTQSAIYTRCVILTRTNVITALKTVI
jgi:predicted transcriptional regulator